RGGDAGPVLLQGGGQVVVAKAAERSLGLPHGGHSPAAVDRPGDVVPASLGKLAARHHPVGDPVVEVLASTAHLVDDHDCHQISSRDSSLARFGSLVVFGDSARVTELLYHDVAVVRL